MTDRWPDGSKEREKWLLHVWYFIPASVIADACIRAKEDDGRPKYLPFLEPDGWKPQADFTCWICGNKPPHTHPQCEIDAARKTLEVFRENVWANLCIPRKPSIPDSAICFFKDGDAWCCVHGDFVNLQESPAGFGDTREKALENLLVGISR